MTYISAVIREALRLHPPAATARMPEHGTGFSRDPSVYRDLANRFVPERWLNEEVGLPETGSTTRRLPASAWRPFERGPRNCIGQEFATFEARVTIAYAARRYDFIKVGLGEIDPDENGHLIKDGKADFQLKSPLYNVSPFISS
ncbi:cytochrome P450 [Astrocystis sublimbata]|nr:cytochrome P450 [Astrocystis sublimbata]